MGTLTTRLWALAAVTAASFALAVACGQQPFTGKSDDAGDQADASDQDATMSDDGGTNGDGPATPEGSADDAPPPFDAPPGVDSGPPEPDSGCGETPIESQGSFVSTNTTNPGGLAPCTPTSPCRTIQDGIAWAKMNSRTVVYVEKGTYTEQVKLADGITVRGGWERDQQNLWQIICDGGAQVDSVHIVAPASANTTVIADGLTQPATLQTVRVFTRPAGPGESLYGLFVSGASTNVTLSYVSINVDPAGDGTAGSQGLVGAAAPTSCTAGGPAAAPGAPGLGGQHGTYGATGYVPGDGSKGGPGGLGPNGKLTTPPACTDGGCASCVYDPSDHGCSGPQAGADVCGTAATFGCGSGGGGGGSPGNGGGSSIGIYAWGGTVTLNNSTVFSASGGGGGPGGAGGGGGNVTSAVQGADKTCVGFSTSSGCDGTGPPPGLCLGSLRGPMVVGSGGKATDGVPGGQGGPGGGGGVGDSYGYFVGSGGSVVVGPNSTVTATGIPAPGGLYPGGNAGVTGYKLDHN